MKIYTLLFGLLLFSQLSAQTVHDWENHHVLQINREPARAAFTPFHAQKGDCSICLDGTWKFRWTPVPDERIVEFYQTDFNDKDWVSFPVPANWEVNGYGTPIYVSAGYPFKIDPPRVMGEGRLYYLQRAESRRTVSPFVSVACRLGSKRPDLSSFRRSDECFLCLDKWRAGRV